MGFRSVMAGFFGLGNPRQQALGFQTRSTQTGNGLHPRDAKGQYISPKANSKRNRGRA